MKEINKINLFMQKLIAENKVKNQEEFGKSLGYKNKSSFSQLLKREDVTDVFRNKILQKYPEYKYYIFNEDFPMVVAEPSPEYSTKPKDGSKNPVPYFNVDFAGGWHSEELFSHSQPDFYINNPEFERSEFACNLVGNSISRRIPNKAIIGLKNIDDWQTYFPTNELYGVVMKNDLRTVKIVKRSKDKENLILIPDPLPEHNITHYEPEEVPVKFVAKFYQIVAWAQLERVAQ